jgi:hypothetical protein
MSNDEKQLQQSYERTEEQNETPPKFNSTIIGSLKRRTMKDGKPFLKGMINGKPVNILPNLGKADTDDTDYFVFQFEKQPEYEKKPQKEKSGEL